jgi:hypothetical protein
VIKSVVNKKYFNIYKLKKYIKKKNKLLNLIYKSKKYNKFFIKKLKYLMKFIKAYFYFNNFYVKYINKLSYIYKSFLNVKTIINMKYLNFSFYLKSRKKKKNNNNNIYKASKKINLIYYINKIIFQFIYYIFIS